MTAKHSSGTRIADQPQPVCNLCHMPAVLIGGKWQHAEAADAAFCALVMRRGQ